jgi:hypothetical protein
VGPPDDQSSRQRRQARYGRRCRPRGRRCLLKGCGRWFQPRHPQARYCSDICRRAAKRWRDWKSKERYRKSERGREKRREQSRRHREREGERSRESFRCAVGGAAWVIAQPRIFMFLRPSVQRCYEIFSRTVVRHRGPSEILLRVMSRSSLSRAGEGASVEGTLWCGASACGEGTPGLSVTYCQEERGSLA